MCTPGVHPRTHPRLRCAPPPRCARRGARQPFPQAAGGKLRQEGAEAARRSRGKGAAVTRQRSHTEPGIDSGSRRCGTNAAPPPPAGSGRGSAPVPASRHHLGITSASPSEGWKWPQPRCPALPSPFPRAFLGFGLWGGISSPRSPPALFDFWPLPGLRCSRWISPPRAARGGRSTPKPSLGVGTGGGCHPQPLTPRCRSPVRGAGAAKIPPRGCVGWGTGAAQRGWGIFGGVRTVPSSGARRVSAVFLPLCAGEAGGAAANTASS